MPARDKTPFPTGEETGHRVLPSTNPPPGDSLCLGGGLMNLIPDELAWEKYRWESGGKKSLSMAKKPGYPMDPGRGFQGFQEIPDRSDGEILWRRRLRGPYLHAGCDPLRPPQRSAGGSSPPATSVNRLASGEDSQDKSFFSGKNEILYSPVILMEETAYFYLVYQHFFFVLSMFFDIFIKIFSLPIS